MNNNMRRKVIEFFSPSEFEQISKNPNILKITRKMNSSWKATSLKKAFNLDVSTRKCSTKDWFTIYNELEANEKILNTSEEGKTSKKVISDSLTKDLDLELFPNDDHHFLVSGIAKTRTLLGKKRVREPSESSEEATKKVLSSQIKVAQSFLQETSEKEEFIELQKKFYTACLSTREEGLIRQDSMTEIFSEWKEKVYSPIKEALLAKLKFGFASIIQGNQDFELELSLVETMKAVCNEEFSSTSDFTAKLTNPTFKKLTAELVKMLPKDKSAVFQSMFFSSAIFPAMQESILAECEETSQLLLPTAPSLELTLV